MTTVQPDGYAYRLESANGATLRQLLTATVFQDSASASGYWEFGAASLWDAVSESGRNSLRPIAQVTTAQQVKLTGDFGHIFSTAAEVRWKRLDQDAYDVLLLTEDPSPQSVAQFKLDHLGTFTSVKVPDQAADLLVTPRKERSQGIQYRLRRIEYRNNDRSVQFVRYLAQFSQKEATS